MRQLPLESPYRNAWQPPPGLRPLPPSGPLRTRRAGSGTLLPATFPEETPAPGPRPGHPGWGRRRRCRCECGCRSRAPAEALPTPAPPSTPSPGGGSSAGSVPLPPPPRAEEAELPPHRLPRTGSSLPAARCPRLNSPSPPPPRGASVRVRRGPASPQRQRRSLEVQNGRRGGARAASARVRDRLGGSSRWRLGEEGG